MKGLNIPFFNQLIFLDLFFQVLLSELGYKQHLFDPLVSEFLNPIAKILYPECVGQKLDSHKTFVVSYAIGKDIDLSYHYDDAEVTLNVALGKNYEGGELYLGGMKNVSDLARNPILFNRFYQF